MKHLIGVDGVAREVVENYIGVDGVAREVVEGYVGVDGVARQFFSGLPRWNKYNCDPYAGDFTREEEMYKYQFQLEGLTYFYTGYAFEEEIGFYPIGDECMIDSSDENSSDAIGMCYVEDFGDDQGMGLYSEVYVCVGIEEGSFLMELEGTSYASYYYKKGSDLYGTVSGKSEFDGLPVSQEERVAVYRNSDTGTITAVASYEYDHTEGWYTHYYYVRQ